jgi:predicted nucleic acid-binding protein
VALGLWIRNGIDETPQFKKLQSAGCQKAVVAAAQDAGCQILCSVDIQHGQEFGTLTVENPFRREAD